ncbi:MAG: alpha/beta hydrolase fold domain-containing protein [Myxococcota bacterium]
MSWLFLLVSVWGALFTYNVYRPLHGGPSRAFVSFLAGWITSEFALHHIAWQALFTLGFVWAGALEAWPGQLGLGITLLSWAGLVGAFWQAHAAGRVIDTALHEALAEDFDAVLRRDPRPRRALLFDWSWVVQPFPRSHPRVEVQRDVIYARARGLDLKLNVYRPRKSGERRPGLMQMHGGGWVVGSKDWDAQPLLFHMAERGWVCFSVNYRLSPHATFPEHMIDLKRARVWIEEHAERYGADPEFIVATGGSAGGHLSAHLALTAGDPEYQPGFESADTSVRGCVPFYGIYDFTPGRGGWRNPGIFEVLEKQVLKASYEEAPELYQRSSPIERIHPGAPPFFVLHGTADSLVPVEQARRFVQAFREKAHAPIAYAEIPGAQHAFDFFHSPRTAYVLDGIERFLTALHRAYLEGRGGPGKLLTELP